MVNIVYEEGSYLILKTPLSLVHTGDILYIENGNSVHKDILLLSCSNDNGDCAVEEVSGEGETVIFKKKCCEQTRTMNTLYKLSNIKGHIRLESSMYNKFTISTEYKGFIKLTKMPRAKTFSNANVLLRGSRLIGTDYCFGIALTSYNGDILYDKKAKQLHLYDQSDSKMLTILIIITIVIIVLKLSYSNLIVQDNVTYLTLYKHSLLIVLIDPTNFIYLPLGLPLIINLLYIILKAKVRFAKNDNIIINNISALQFFGRTKIMLVDTSTLLNKSLNYARVVGISCKDVIIGDDLVNLIEKERKESELSFNKNILDNTIIHKQSKELHTIRRDRILEINETKLVQLLKNFEADIKMDEIINYLKATFFRDSYITQSSDINWPSQPSCAISKELKCYSSSLFNNKERDTLEYLQDLLDQEYKVLAIASILFSNIIPFLYIDRRKSSIVFADNDKDTKFMNSDKLYTTKIHIIDNKTTEHYSIDYYGSGNDEIIKTKRFSSSLFSMEKQQNIIWDNNYISHLNYHYNSIFDRCIASLAASLGIVMISTTQDYIDIWINGVIKKVLILDTYTKGDITAIAAWVEDTNEIILYVLSFTFNIIEYLAGNVEQKKLFFTKKNSVMQTGCSPLILMYRYLDCNEIKIIIRELKNTKRNKDYTKKPIIHMIRALNILVTIWIDFRGELHNNRFLRSCSKHGINTWIACSANKYKCISTAISTGIAKRDCIFFDFYKHWAKTYKEINLITEKNFVLMSTVNYRIQRILGSFYEIKQKSLESGIQICTIFNGKSLAKLVQNLEVKAAIIEIIIGTDFVIYCRAHLDYDNEFIKLLKYGFTPRPTITLITNKKKLFNLIEVADCFITVLNDDLKITYETINNTLPTPEITKYEQLNSIEKKTIPISKKGQTKNIAYRSKAIKFARFNQCKKIGILSLFSNFNDDSNYYSIALSLHSDIIVKSIEDLEYLLYSFASIASYYKYKILNSMLLWSLTIGLCREFNNIMQRNNVYAPLFEEKEYLIFFTVSNIALLSETFEYSLIIGKRPLTQFIYRQMTEFKTVYLIIELVFVLLTNIVYSALVFHAFEFYSNLYGIGQALTIYTAIYLLSTNLVNRMMINYNLSFIKIFEDYIRYYTCIAEQNSRNETEVHQHVRLNLYSLHTVYKYFQYYVTIFVAVFVSIAPYIYLLIITNSKEIFEYHEIVMLIMVSVIFGIILKILLNLYIGLSLNYINSELIYIYRIFNEKLEQSFYQEHLIKKHLAEIDILLSIIIKKYSPVLKLAKQMVPWNNKNLVIQGESIVIPSSLALDDEKTKSIGRLFTVSEPLFEHASTKNKSIKTIGNFTHYLRNKMFKTVYSKKEVANGNSSLYELSIDDVMSYNDDQQDLNVDKHDNASYDSNDEIDKNIYKHMHRLNDDDPNKYQSTKVEAISQKLLTISKSNVPIMLNANTRPLQNEKLNDNYKMFVQKLNINLVLYKLVFLSFILLWCISQITVTYLAKCKFWFISFNRNLIYNSSFENKKARLSADNLLYDFFSIRLDTVPMCNIIHIIEARKLQFIIGLISLVWFPITYIVNKYGKHVERFHWIYIYLILIISCCVEAEADDTLNLVPSFLSYSMILSNRVLNKSVKKMFVLLAIVLITIYMNRSTYYDGVQIIINLVIYTAQYLLACYNAERISFQLYAELEEINSIKYRQIDILTTMLPEFIVDAFITRQLNDNGIPVGLKAETPGIITVIFCDIDDFQEIVNKVSPNALVELLDKIYLYFDNLLPIYNVVKIETVFETYLSCTGFKPGSYTKNNNILLAAQNALDFCLAMLQCVASMSYSYYDYKSEMIVNQKLAVKIGLDTGIVMTGLVGSKKPQYALFGDTVNTASRMKQTGKANHIHITSRTYEYLKYDKTLLWIPSTISVKGKGEMNTYFLKQVFLLNYPFVPETIEENDFLMEIPFNDGLSYQSIGFDFYDKKYDTNIINNLTSITVRKLCGRNYKYDFLIRDYNSLNDHDKAINEFIRYSWRPIYSNIPYSSIVSTFLDAKLPANYNFIPTSRDTNISNIAAIKYSNTFVKFKDNDSMPLSNEASASDHNENNSTAKMFEYKESILNEELLNNEKYNFNDKSMINMFLLYFKSKQNEHRYNESGSYRYASAYTLATTLFIYIISQIVQIGSILNRLQLNEYNLLADVKVFGLLKYSIYTYLLIKGLQLFFGSFIFVFFNFSKSREQDVTKQQSYYTNILFLFTIITTILVPISDFNVSVISSTTLVNKLSYLLDIFRIIQTSAFLHHSGGFQFHIIILIDIFIFCLFICYINKSVIREAETITALCTLVIVLLCELLAVYIRQLTHKILWFNKDSLQRKQLKIKEMLLDMMPQNVMNELQSDTLKLSYTHNNISFLFADIVGFTAYSTTVTPNEVIDLLQELFGAFDHNTTKLGIFKLCTIGDAYVAITQNLEEAENFNGISSPDVIRIWLMAKSMLADIKRIATIKNIPNLNMRIGIHFGSCIGGVVGSGRLRYDFWGKDVLIGNKMETMSKPGLINVSKPYRIEAEKIISDLFIFDFNTNVEILGNMISCFFMKENENSTENQQYDILVV